MAETAALNARTHEAYLQFANTMERTLTENIALQMQRIAAGAGGLKAEAGGLKRRLEAEDGGWGLGAGGW